MEVCAEGLSPADPDKKTKQEDLNGHLQAACPLQHFTDFVDAKFAG
jgi:hypothetical protein